MVEIKTGEVYAAARVRSGSNANGSWQFVTVKEDGKGRKEILIWVGNHPQPIEEGGKFRLTGLGSVKFASRKDNTGQWRDECNVSGTIEPVMSADEAAEKGVYPPSSSTYTELDDDGELPF